ncbi:MAG: (2Fe-2S)-binding protein [Deltaproteobacteria bacterium]|nr:(2Fe-2S)-binding protein [Deltaproteobacteria bacterium]
MPQTSDLVSGTIDGREVAVPWGTTLLEAAASIGTVIPTLCHHPALPPDGNCRLCLVEVDSRLAASCLFPLRRSGFSVSTESPKVFEARAFVLKLLLSRAPNDEYLKELAVKYEAAPDPRLGDLADGCVRCGRCVRACQATGTEAISLVGRSQERQVTGPFFEPPAQCVGCLACAKVCPTGYIVFSEERTSRSIWGRDFEMVLCPICGEPVGSLQELARAGAAEELCPACRRRAMASALVSGPGLSL